jgi:hypothetical protein
MSETRVCREDLPCLPVEKSGGSVWSSIGRCPQKKQPPAGSERITQS